MHNAAVANARLARGEHSAALELFLEAESGWHAVGGLGDSAGASLNAASIEIELGSVDSARRRIAGLVDGLPALRDLTLIAYAAGTVSAIAADDGDAEVAARLLGAANRLAEDAGVPFFGAGEREIWGRRRSLVESALDGEAFARAYEIGAAYEEDELLGGMRAVLAGNPRLEDVAGA